MSPQVRFHLEALHEIPIVEVALELDMIHRVHRGPITVLCPFHHDRRKGNAYLFEDHFYCFACHQWANSIDLVKVVKDVTFVEACRYLHDTFAIPYLSDDAPLPPTFAHADLQLLGIKRTVRSQGGANHRERHAGREVFLSADAGDSLVFRSDSALWAFAGVPTKAKAEQRAAVEAGVDVSEEEMQEFLFWHSDPLVPSEEPTLATFAPEWEEAWPYRLEAFAVDDPEAFATWIGGLAEEKEVEYLQAAYQLAHSLHFAVFRCSDNEIMLAALEKAAMVHAAADRILATAAKLQEAAKVASSEPLPLQVAGL